MYTVVSISCSYIRERNSSDTIHYSVCLSSRRLGKGANVFLASAELAAVTAIEGKLPSVAEYMKYSDKIQATSAVCLLAVLCM